MIRANGAATLQRRLNHHLAEAATPCGVGCGESLCVPLLARCYIVEHGQFIVKVTKDDGSTHDVSAIGPGGCFGEMSLLYSAKRTASVAAQGPSSVWAMHREVHTHIASRSPSHPSLSPLCPLAGVPADRRGG